MDFLSIVGVILSFAVIIGGNFFEGGAVASLVNVPAAFIVFGGTLGAAMLQTPKATMFRALSIFSWVFKPPVVDYNKGVDKVVAWANVIRKKGLLGLEEAAEDEQDKFSRKALELLIDGHEIESVRRVMENELFLDEQRDIDAVRFYESMGGYAPTIGIIGAVMGLIHVMRNLADPETLGPGIAVAFVATIYGVALANLFLLPIANKLKMCVNRHSQYRELIIEGVLSIANGEHPKAIATKLDGYLR